MPVPEGRLKVAQHEVLGIGLQQDKSRRDD
jgi:hypothetical protein